MTRGTKAARTGKVRAALYSRVSTTEQASKGTTSLAEQEHACRDYAEQMGWQVVRTFSDPGVSGTAFNRPGLTAMLAALRSGEFAVIVVAKLDRLARTEPVRLLIMHELAELEADFVALDLAGIDYRTDEGELNHGVVGTVNAFARKQTLRRLANGQRGKARHGGYPGGMPPYGWKVVGHGRTAVLVINEAEAEVLRMVVSWIVDEGLRRPNATVRLNQLGYRQRNGKPFHPDSLRDMLRSPCLKGEFQWGGSRKASGKYGEAVRWQAEGGIITAERWDALQAACNERARPRSGKRTYPLGDRTMIASCGAFYGGKYRSSGASRAYKCNGRRWQAGGDTEKCSCPTLTASEIETRVWGGVAALLGDGDRLEALAEAYLGMGEQAAPSKQGELSRVRGRIAKLETSVTTVVVEYAQAGLPAQAVKAAIDKIEADLAALRVQERELVQWQAARTQQAQATGSLRVLAERAASRLANPTLEMQAEVLRLLRVRVEVLEPTRTPPVRVLGSVPVPSPSPGNSSHRGRP